MLLTRVSTKNSLTGRIALSGLKKYLSGSYETHIQVATKDWQPYYDQKVGWIDFGFLTKQ